jgi:hypothetical protein
MANYTFTFPGNTACPDGQRVPRYAVADTDAGKPASGVEKGDLCFCVDTGTIYKATAQNVWTNISSAAVDPQINANAPGSFTIPTEKYVVMSRRLTLTGTQRVTLAGTARLRVA